MLSFMNGNEVVKKLQAAGWTVARINGSHHVMTNGNQSVSVPAHGKRDLKLGLIAGIARQTGVKLK